jgi:predicted NAD/FAD-binding protein
MNTARKRIAVIGAGISGLAAAYLLNRRHDVVLFEAGSYLGGHANTVDIELEGQRCAVDTGFLVYNDKTYPNLIALFDELGVASIASDMSFGVSMDDGALEWAGTNLDTVFAQRRRWHRRLLGMLRDILHFNRRAEAFLADAIGRRHAGPAAGTARLRRHVPRRLPAADGGGDLVQLATRHPAFPAATFLRFCLNHALLQVNDRPQWRTVRGGSRNTCRRIAATLPDCRLNTPVQRGTPRRRPRHGQQQRPRRSV